MEAQLNGYGGIGGWKPSPELLKNLLFFMGVAFLIAGIVECFTAWNAPPDQAQSLWIIGIVCVVLGSLLIAYCMYLMKKKLDAEDGEKDVAMLSVV